ncbi:MAG TPA: type II toxin-antitoxin system VapC family toxin [Coriobacteriia bacterium]|jgi:predicted nucleic acid-binding protein
MKLVVDASAFVKLLVPEDGSARMLELAQAEAEFLAPDWLLAETAMALWKYVRRGELATEDALDALTEGERYDVELTPAQELLPEALALACALPHPLYDTLYILLALRGGRALATGDTRMREAAEALGIRVEWVGG